MEVLPNFRLRKSAIWTRSSSTRSRRRGVETLNEGRTSRRLHRGIVGRLYGPSSQRVAAGLGTDRRNPVARPLPAPDAEKTHGAGSLRAISRFHLSARPNRRPLSQETPDVRPARAGSSTISDLVRLALMVLSCRSSVVLAVILPRLLRRSFPGTTEVDLHPAWLGVTYYGRGPRGAPSRGHIGSTTCSSGCLLRREEGRRPGGRRRWFLASSPPRVGGFTGARDPAGLVAGEPDCGFPVRSAIGDPDQCRPLHHRRAFFSLPGHYWRDVGWQVGHGASADAQRRDAGQRWRFAVTSLLHAFQSPSWCGMHQLPIAIALSIAAILGLSISAGSTSL